MTIVCIWKEEEDKELNSRDYLSYVKRYPQSWMYHITILYLYVWDEFMYFEIRLGSYSVVTIIPYVFFREGFAMGMFVRLMHAVCQYGLVDSLDFSPKLNAANAELDLVGRWSDETMKAYPNGTCLSSLGS